MSFMFTPRQLVVLPRLDAEGAIALAQSLEAAAVQQRAVLEQRGQTSVLEALDELASDREALASALLSLAASGQVRLDVREADRREDTAITVLHDLLAAWARLADEMFEGRTAEQLYHRLFGQDGISCVNLPVEQEWAAINHKLRIIADEGLADELARLGATSLLRHLRSVHEAYGQAIDGTQPQPPSSEPPAIRQRREALLASVRLYVLRVAASEDRRHTGSGELADALLRPLSERRAQASDRATGSESLEKQDEPA